ncbi:MAG TPA: RDD family protein [Steroidobacteraceae bacterium]|nr:RDD family protein [Steroidobacteraceae bacterium]
MGTELSATLDPDGPPSPAPGLIGVRFWVRAWGQIIDMVVHNAWWFVSAFAFTVGVGIYAGITATPVEPLIGKLFGSSWSWPDFFGALLGFTLYHAVMERVCGATVGKRLLGLVAVSSDGTALRFRAALGRSLAFNVDGLFFGLPAYDAMKLPPHQRLGDKWCDTLVVKRSLLPPARPVTGGFMGALCLGLLSDSLCYAAAAWVKLL